MDSFQSYFKLGLHHVLSLQGLELILFVLALSAVYVARDAGKILILVTLFTLGYALTLALATFHVVQINRELIRFLIPVTIAVMALFSIFRPRPSYGKGIQLNYLLAVFFGLIHGLGVSSHLKDILAKGASTWQVFLGFLVGLEAGQLIVAAVFLLVTALLSMLGVNRKEWTLIVAAFVLGVACMLILDARFW